MQRLEAELGFALFTRTGRSARINARGERTLAQAQELIRLYEGLGGVPEGEHPAVLVRIGAIVSAQTGLLPQALAQFHLAVIIRPPFSLQSDLRWTTLAHEPFRLLVPKKLRGSDWAQLLATQPFVRYDRSSFGGRQVDRFLRSAHLEVREVSELDELDAIVRLVAHGVGVALVPQTAAQVRWPAGVRAIDLGRHTFHRDIGLIQRGKHNTDEPAGALAQAVCAAYGA